jgi:hypothetical protein
VRLCRYAGVWPGVWVTRLCDDGQAGGGLRVKPVVAEDGIVKPVVASWSSGWRLSQCGIPLDTWLFGWSPRGQWAVEVAMDGASRRRALIAGELSPGRSRWPVALSEWQPRMILGVTDVGDS